MCSVSKIMTDSNNSNAPDESPISSHNVFIKFRNPRRRHEKIEITNSVVGDGHFFENKLETEYCRSGCSGDDAKGSSENCCHNIQPPSIRRSASKKLQNNVDSMNCFETLKFAKLVGNTDLLNKAQTFLIQNFESVVKTSPDKFVKLPLEDVLSTLSHDQLSVTSEEIVWEAALDWIKHKQYYRKYKVNELLMKIRTGLLDRHYFEQNVKENEFVRDNASCLPIIKMTERFFDDAKCLKIFAELEATPNIATARSGRIPNQVLFTFGGISEDENLDDSLIVEYFDKRTNRWRKFDVQEDQRAYHGTIAKGYEVFIVGGCCADERLGMDYLKSCRVFNALQKTWRDLTPLNAHRGFVSVAAMEDRYIYAVGGIGRSRHVLNTAERYDSLSDSWTFISPMRTHRAQACATALKGKLYVMGGWNECEWLQSVETFDPETNQWTCISPMQQVRAGASCVMYHNSIFIIGGYNGDEVANSGEKYDLISNKWIRIPPMLEALSEFSATVFEGKIVCVGGEKCEGAFYALTDNVQYFEPNTSRWSKMPRMVIPRHALSACVVEFPSLDSCAADLFS